LISATEGILQTARDNYGVDPVIFLVIYLAAGPVFYYSLFRTLQAITKKQGRELMLWSAIFLCASAAPFVYVLFFGHNIPWWVYTIIGLLICQGGFSLTMKLRKALAARV
jgi:hypothetical protein